VATDEEEMAEVLRKQGFYQKRGVRVEVLDGAAVAKAEPNLRTGLRGGLRVQEDAVLYPPCAARFLLDRARDKGAQMRTGTDVRELLPEGGVVLADRSRISADISVNATGPWSPSLDPGLPVRKRKGHLVITDRYPGFVHHQIVELGYLKSAHGAAKDSVAFNIQPRPTGQLLLGSSRQFDVADSTVDWKVLRRMMDRGFAMMPGLRELSVIRVWTGVRAATEDNQPFIGPVPGLPKVYMAAGHEGLGATTALGVAELVTAAAAGRMPAIPLEPYL